MSTHTPEPWMCISDWKHIRSENTGEFIAGVVLRPSQKNKLAESPNAERIVACVNALAGISDPVAAIQAAREALSNVLVMQQMGVISETDEKGVYDSVEEALTLLTPNK